MSTYLDITGKSASSILQMKENFDSKQTSDSCERSQVDVTEKMLRCSAISEV